jgi:hypothetical protein
LAHYCGVTLVAPNPDTSTRFNHTNPQGWTATPAPPATPETDRLLAATTTAIAKAETVTAIDPTSSAVTVDRAVPPAVVVVVVVAVTETGVRIPHAAAGGEARDET